MPRPKRTKVAPSKPISFATIAAEKSKPSEPERAHSPASASVSSSRRTNTSDDSDGLVTANKSSVHRRGVAPLEVTMSGALAVEDIGEIGTRPLSSKRRVTLSRIAREADHAKAIESLRAQKDATVAAEKLANERKRIEIQLPSTQTSKPFMAKAGSSTHPLVNPVRDSEPTQSARTKATPSRETSILDIENFKRRPRQPSLLQIARAQIAAEGSSLDDTLEEFEPDDQSTPLHQSHTGPQPHLSSSPGRLSSSRKRKLSTPEIQVPASQSQGPQDRSSPAASLPDNLFDIAATDSQPEDPPLPTVPVANPAVPSCAVDRDILAPPRSSSPIPPQNRTRQTDSRTKRPQAARKPISKAPELKNRSKQRPSTAFPPRSPSPRRLALPSTTRSPLKPLTTSALQNFLPRRRRVVSKNKENNVFELNTSSDLDAFDDGILDEDADELSHHVAAKIGARKTGGGKPKRTTGRKGKAAAANGVGSKAKAGKRPGATTYARKQNLELGDGNEDAGSSGGEEEEDEEAGAVARAGKASEEMRRKAAFFREEVDVWGLEFEEVTGSSDRMRDAR
ncbi:MAG: hypothetical protein Q9173_000081 [Seirophora scorigena]